MQIIKNKTMTEAKHFYVNGRLKDTKEVFKNYLISSDFPEVPAEKITDETETNGVEDKDIFMYGLSEKEIQQIINDGDRNEITDFVLTSYRPMK